MPVFDFKEDSTSNWRLVIGRMVYPSDDVKYVRYLCYGIWDQEWREKPEEIIQIPAERVLKILHSDSYAQVMKEAGKQMLRGHVVGYMLFMMAQLEANGKKASKNKVARITEHYMKTETDAPEEGEGLSKSKIWEYWKEYKSVAHYWAAAHSIKHEGLHLTNAHDLMTPAFQKEGLPHTDSDLALFLEVADSFLDFGTKFKPYHSKQNSEPLLKLETTWLPSKDFSYKPSTFSALTFVPVPEWAEKIHNKKNKRSIPSL